MTSANSWETTSWRPIVRFICAPMLLRLEPEASLSLAADAFGVLAIASAFQNELFLKPSPRARVQ